MTYYRTITTVEEQESLLKFVQLAADAFGANPKLASYGDPGPGNYLALRWGILDRGIMVVKQSREFKPMNFIGAVKPS